VQTKYLTQQDAAEEFVWDSTLKKSDDGRCDSPGYSAKYRMYSLMDSAIDLILDYKLIELSDTEKEDNWATTFLLDKGLSIDTIATDRHRGVGALIIPTSIMFGTRLRMLLNSLHKHCEHLS